MPIPAAHHPQLKAASGSSTEPIGRVPRGQPRGILRRHRRTTFVVEPFGAPSVQPFTVDLFDPTEVADDATTAVRAPAVISRQQRAIGGALMGVFLYVHTSSVLLAERGSQFLLHFS
jgi:hypothetical protein